MTPTPRRSRASLELDRARSKALFAEFAATRSPEAREQLTFAYTGVVRYLASRFANRGEPLEDLIQVGMIGLLKAIDRFDVSRGYEFITFALPTIVGEIKRHFRDKGWALHVPRKLQDLNLAVTRAAETLAVELSRSVTVDDIARTLGVSSERVIEAQELGHAYNAFSLDAALSSSEGLTTAKLAERIGVVDGNLIAFEETEGLKQACEALDETERLVLYLRFYEELPQTEIARRLNVSQMNVSRVQRRAIRKLQQHMTAAGDTGDQVAQVEA